MAGLKNYYRLRRVMGWWYIQFAIEGTLELPKSEGPFSWKECQALAEELDKEGWKKEQ